MNLPSDNFILLSVINTKLRDEYASLESLCNGEGIDEVALCARMLQAGYRYSPEQNAFRPV